MTRAGTRDDKSPFPVSDMTVQIFLTIVMVFGIAIMGGIWRSLRNLYYVAKQSQPIVNRTRRSIVVLSRYLPIIGIYIFGAGSITLDMLYLIKSSQCVKYGGQIEPDGWEMISTSELVTNIIFNAIKVAFFVVQVSFLNRFSKLSLGKSRWLSNAIFAILAANCCIWVFAFLEETHGLQGHDDDHKDGHYPGNKTHKMTKRFSEGPRSSVTEEPHPDNDNLLVQCIHGNTSFGRYLDVVRPYLYPFTMEYSILSAGLLFHMWLPNHHDDHHGNIGKTEQMTDLSQGTREAGTADHRPGEWDQSASSDLIQEPLRFRRCGLIFNFALVLTLIQVILAAMLYNHDNFQVILYLHYCYQLIFYILMLLACAIALVALRRTPITIASFTVEDFLLLVSSLGMFILFYFTFTASFTMIVDGYQPEGLGAIPALIFVDSILNIVDVIVQTSLLIRASRIQPGMVVSNQDGSVLERNAPYVLAQTLSFLAICNLGQWGLDSFVEVKADEAFGTVQGFFFGESWGLIKHATYPLCIFYRFHSLIHIVNILPAVLASQD